MNPVLDKGFAWFDAHVGLQDARKQRYRPCSWSPLLTLHAAEARDSRNPRPSMLFLLPRGICHAGWAGS